MKLHYFTLQNKVTPPNHDGIVQWSYITENLYFCIHSTNVRQIPAYVQTRYLPKNFTATNLKIKILETNCCCLIFDNLGPRSFGYSL